MNLFSVAKIFSDNMVLQRNKPIKVWGEGQENNSISVSINDIEVTVKVENGKWMAVLPPMEATECCEMRIRCINVINKEIVIKNIAIGEVWIAGGQSNMEFPLKFDAEGKEFISSANNPHIRFYDSPKISYHGQENHDDFSEYGFWRIFNREGALYFSAVAYYFANKIYTSEKVPVGIVGCNWAGTTASAWLHEKYLEMDEDIKVYLNEYEEAVKDLDLGEYEKKYQEIKKFSNSPEEKNFLDGLLEGTISNEQLDEKLSQMNSMMITPLVGPKYCNRPAALYHNMVEKIAGYSVRGVIWYQGESDQHKASIYSRLFSELIKCWREACKEELPFLFVQLAPFGSWLGADGSNFPVLREQQEIVSKTVTKAYMASIMDAGMKFDIHPKRKRQVGERLALLARNKVYGEDVISEAPEVEGFEFKDNIIKISFKNVSNKLILKGKKINGIQIYVDKKEIYDFRSKLKDNTIYIESEMLKEKSMIEVKFAWTDYVEVNLYSSENLPVKPFKIAIK